MNLKLLEVPEGRWDRLRQRMARRLLEAQDTVLRAYFAQKYGQITVCGDEGSRAAKPRGLEHLGLEVYAQVSREGGSKRPPANDREGGGELSY